MSNNIIYLHGFASSGNSFKGEFLKSVYNAITPDLTSHPKTDIEIIEELLKKNNDPLLVGSSLGGFYSEYFSRKYNLRALYINPLVDITTAKDFIGEHIYFNSLKKFCFTEEDYNYLHNMLCEIEKMSYCSRPRSIIVAKNDKLLNYNLALEYFNRSSDRVITYETGGHSLNSKRWISEALDRLVSLT